MADSVFIDSNIWVYLFVEEEQQTKHQTAITLVEKIYKQSNIVISIQIVNETHWTLQRRYKVTEKLIREYIKGMIAVANIIPLTLIDYQNAQELRVHYSFSFWDSLIVASALRANCNILYSEDMHHDLVVQENMSIQNPFQIYSSR